MSTATLTGPEPVAPACWLRLAAGVRHSLTLTWRSILKIRTNSEDLIGLSLQPIMFLLLFTYVFGGAIAHGSVHAYLEYVLPGIIVQTVLFATLGTGLMLNADISAGVFDLVPQPADRTLGAARRRDPGRRHPVHHLGRGHARLRDRAGLPHLHQPAGAAGRVRPGAAVRARDVLDLGADRAAR